VERGRLRSWVGRHRRRILIALGALVLVVRVALPSVLRRVIESQANAAVAGRVTVGDVDLYLLRGAVALDDVALRFENAPPENPPVVAFKRFYVNVGYLPFLFHTVRIQDVELDGLAADVDREADGTFVLPALRPPPPDAPPPPEEPAGKEPARPWSIVVDRADIREGTLTLDDHIVTPPVTVSLGLPAMDLVGFNLQYGRTSARATASSRRVSATGACGSRRAWRDAGRILVRRSSRRPQRAARQDARPRSAAALDRFPRPARRRAHVRSASACDPGRERPHRAPRPPGGRTRRERTGARLEAARRRDRASRPGSGSCT
jgi:hypothetical protein